jgi:hypothetical protein
VGPHPPHASVLRLTPSPRPAQEKPRRLARWQAAGRNPSGLRAYGVSFSPPPPSAPTAGQQPRQMWHLACWSAAAPAFTTSRHDARCSGAPADTCRTWLRPCAGGAVAYPRGLASPPHAPTCRGLSRGLHGERAHAEGAAGISGGGGGRRKAESVSSRTATWMHIPLSDLSWSLPSCHRDISRGSRISRPLATRGLGGEAQRRIERRAKGSMAAKRVCANTLAACGGKGLTVRPARSPHMCAAQLSQPGQLGSVLAVSALPEHMSQLPSPAAAAFRLAKQLGECTLTPLAISRAGGHLAGLLDRRQQPRSNARPLHGLGWERPVPVGRGARPDPGRAGGHRGRPCAAVREAAAERQRRLVPGRGLRGKGWSVRLLA